MKLRLSRFSSLGVSAMLVVACSYAQTAPQTAGAQSAPLTAAQSAPESAQNLKLVSADARLTHDLNAKDAAQGQRVTAKLTSDVKAADGMNLEKGTMLTGKVEQVRKSSDNGPSQISVVFNEARLKDGKTVPVKATLLGAYPPNSGSYYADTGSNGALMAGEPASIPADQKIVQEAGTLSHVTMRSAVQSNVSATFTSKDRDVNLKRGTRLQIAIAPMMGAGTAS